MKSLTAQILERILLKYCRRCSRYKRLWEFQRNANKWDGHTRTCAKCVFGSH
jgi:hypothetical protein